jgi:hypothetical protein
MRSILLSAAFAVVILAGCDPSSHCDPGQIFRDNACYTPPPIQPDASATDETDAGAPICAPYEGFGESCTADWQCRCGLDSCNTFTGNYCTHTGCLQDPSICPEKWTCLDLTAMGLGSACARP